MRRSKHLLPMAALAAAMGLWLVAGAGYIHAKALLAQVLLDRAFAATLAEGHAVKPWPWADMTPIARLEVPRLGGSAIVLGGASGQALAFGPAHVNGSALPGEPGTTVIAGHRDTHFAFLGRLQTGDEIRLTGADGRSDVYRVTHMSVADSRAGPLGLDDQARSLLLVTCYPLDARLSGPLRYLVHAEAVAAVPQPSAAAASRLMRWAMEARPLERCCDR